ncbi:MAG: sugar ABC transporter ATP-binding protein, partial [Candidatus Aenigmarchaeota archaeon]|nr:sugar ABC transporter ATP-binding protein [Candidatus Aenigmarchaeota archaeon]
MTNESMEITVKGLTKSFAGVRALKDINLTLSSNDINAIVGANGAGKSTFVKILSGVYPEYGGEIEINGQKVIFNSPLKALKFGINTVYQEVDEMLVPYFNVAENLFLAEQKYLRRKYYVSEAYFIRKAGDVLNKINFRLPFDVRRRASTLSVSEKQLLIIAKILLSGARFIMFDEPTASLGPQDSAALFAVIKSLKERGVGILYISHRIPEIFEISNRITVFRDGQKIDTFETRKTNVNKIVRAMLGRDINRNQYIERKNINFKNNDILLSVKSLHGNNVGPVSFDLKRGEILGITGLVGAGKTELITALYGSRKVDGYDVYLENKKLYIKSVKDAVAEGIYLVPEDRRKLGLIVGEDIEWNSTIPTLKFFVNFFGILRRNLLKKWTKKIIAELNIVCDGPQQAIKNLSGGNQQKVVIGKWLIREELKDAKVFIFDESTTGIDVGAKEEVYKLVEDIASKGCGVIFVSSDIDEVIRITDRILVMYKYKIVGEMGRQSATSEKVLYLAVGG